MLAITLYAIAGALVAMLVLVIVGIFTVLWRILRWGGGRKLWRNDSQ